MFEKKSPNTDFSFTLTMRQLSSAMAGLLAFSFFIFIAGYFFGQKRAAEDFVYRADQDSLADQIYSSMCVLCDSKDEEEPENSEETETAETELVVEANDTCIAKKDMQEEAVSETEIPQKKYRAILSGFPASHLDDAKKLIARLNAKGYPSELLERTSSYKGQSKIWYQVITPSNSREYLDKCKAQLAKIGYIKEESIKIE